MSAIPGGYRRPKFRAAPSQAAFGRVGKITVRPIPTSWEGSGPVDCYLMRL